MIRDLVKKLLGFETKGYKPDVTRFYDRPRDLPPMDFRVIRWMLRDPTIRLGLAVRAAQVASAQWAFKEGGEWKDGIKADDPRVAEYVEEQINRIWKHYIDKLTRCQTWGWAAGEVTYKLRERDGRKVIEVDELHDRRAEDSYAIKDGGRVVGVEFRRLRGIVGGKLEVDFPKSYWVGYEPEAGSPYGETVLDGAYSPWADDFFEGGAKAVRRLFMRKDAYSGMTIAYPYKTYQVEQTDGSVRSFAASELANQIVQQALAGQVITHPNDMDASGNPLWKVERAKVASNPTHILEYPKDLDVEKLRGLLIPDEIIVTVSGGTGAWAGRQVPMQTFFKLGDQFVAMIVRCVVEQILEPMVALNFGSQGTDFEVCAKPFEEIAKESGGLDESGGGDKTRMRPEDPFQQPQPIQGRQTRGQAAPQRMSSVSTDEDAQDVVSAIRGATRRILGGSRAIRFGSGPHEYSCILARLDEETADAIRDMSMKIDDLDLVDDGRETEPHITVKYGLHSTDPEQATHLLDSWGAFSAKLGKTLVFEGSDHDVVVLGVESRALHELNRRIVEAMPNTETHDYYIPHVTLAYVKKGEGQKYEGMKDIDGTIVSFDRLVFCPPLDEETEIKLQGIVQFSSRVNGERLRDEKGRFVKR